MSYDKLDIKPKGELDSIVIYHYSHVYQPQTINKIYKKYWDRLYPLKRIQIQFSPKFNSVPKYHVILGASI